MNYAPQGKPRPVVQPGEFVFAAAFLEHGHIYGQCNGLIEAGAALKWVYDPDPAKAKSFLGKYPGTSVARSFGELVLDCLIRTEKAMTQAHAFKAAELCLLAQAAARRITP
jgi:hypothetical protein